MRHPDDDRDREMLMVAHFPDCPACGRAMRRPPFGNAKRQAGLLVCCDPRCYGQVDDPDADSVAEADAKVANLAG